jgi:hypothetical protein
MLNWKINYDNAGNSRYFAKSYIYGVEGPDKYWTIHVTTRRDQLVWQIFGDLKKLTIRTDTSEFGTVKDAQDYCEYIENALTKPTSYVQSVTNSVTTLDQDGDNEVEDLGLQKKSR